MGAADLGAGLSVLVVLVCRAVLGAEVGGFPARIGNANHGIYPGDG